MGNFVKDTIAHINPSTAHTSLKFHAVHTRVKVALLWLKWMSNEYFDRKIYGTYDTLLQ